MSVYIDTPAWSAHGMLWAHLVSDTSVEELHEFAAAAGIPRRGFERDHYDVPAERWDDLVARGAVPLSSREIVSRLRAAGMRQPKYPALHPEETAEPAEPDRR